MFDQNTNSDIRNRLRNHPVERLASPRPVQDIRRLPRRFKPENNSAPKSANPIAQPYSRRPTSSTFIDEILVVRKKVLPKLQLPQVSSESLRSSQKLRSVVSSSQDNLVFGHKPVRSTVLKRQSVGTPVKQSHPVAEYDNKKPLTRNKTQLAMTGTAVLIFTAGLWLSFSALNTLISR